MALILTIDITTSDLHESAAYHGYLTLKGNGIRFEMKNQHHAYTISRKRAI